MNTLAVAVFVSLAVSTFAYDDGQWHGHGGYGHYDYGNYGGYGHGLVSHGVAAVGPSAGYAIVAAPATYGHGYGGAFNGGYSHGYGHGFGNGHAVVVKGPATVPATIIGPSGKIYAEGLYGIGHGYHGYGHHY